MISSSVKPLSRAGCAIASPFVAGVGHARVQVPYSAVIGVTDCPLEGRRDMAASLRLATGAKISSRRPSRCAPGQTELLIDRGARTPGRPVRNRANSARFPRENTHARSTAEVHEGEGPGLHPDRAPRRHHHHRHPRRHRHPGLPQPAQEGRRRVPEVGPQERRDRRRDLGHRQPRRPPIRRRTTRRRDCRCGTWCTAGFKVSPATPSRSPAAPTTGYCIRACNDGRTVALASTSSTTLRVAAAPGTMAATHRGTVVRGHIDLAAL